MMILLVFVVDFVFRSYLVAEHSIYNQDLFLSSDARESFRLLV